MTHPSHAATIAIDGRAPAARRPGRRILGLSFAIWVCIVAALAVFGGAGYTIWLARTSPPAPTLPAGPPHAISLSQTSTTDMLQGNFITTTALYRSSEAPAAVIEYYRKLLKGHVPQFGQFDSVTTTTAPSDTPAAALQYMPALFNSPTASDSYAARYVYTEYSSGQDDVAVAIDVRHAKGPTLVYMEMLTQPQ